MLKGDIIYANSGKTRDLPIAPDLEQILKETAAAHGFDLKVVSGGQSKKKRTGSDRHDHGHAGDLQLLKDGKVVDIESNKEVVAPFFTDLVKKGVKSIGYSPSYMGTKTFHADNAVDHGQGVKGVKYWGENGKSDAAPAWLKTAVDRGYDNSLNKSLNSSQISMKVPNSNPVKLKKLNNKFDVNVQDVPEWVPTDASGIRNWRSMSSTSSPAKTALVGEQRTNPNSGAITTIADEANNSKPGNFQKLGKVTSDLIPYLSNLYNSTLKPAAVPRPVFNAPIKLQRVNMDADRTSVNNDYRASVGNADQTLDGNTAVPVKMFAKGLKFNQLSQVNQLERNQNNQIANQETLTNAQIAQRNNQMVYDTRMLEADRTNTIQSAKSANLANASDKYMMQQNAKAQADLENEKIQLLMDSDQYGTWKRFQQKKASKQMKFGGSITSGSVFKKLKSIY